MPLYLDDRAKRCCVSVNSKEAVVEPTARDSRIVMMTAVFSSRCS